MDRPDAGAEPLLRGERLIRTYAGEAVVDVEGIDVRAGEVLAVLGPNGAGKSTLMRLLAGLEAPDSGRLLYKGRAVSAGDPELRRAAAAVLQHPYLWRGTVAQNVEYGLHIRGLSRPELESRVTQTLEMLGVAQLREAPVDTLSGGEAQRVALARALVIDPEILFLDEPTADLDVAVRRQLLEDLERIVSRAESAIVLITHDPAEAFALADRVSVIERGRIVQTGTPTDLFEAPATEFVASFTGAEFMLRGRIEEVEDGALIVRLDSGGSLEVAGEGAPGGSVQVAYRPEDVVIGLPGAAGAAGAAGAVGAVGAVGAAVTSARNRFDATVTRVRPQGGLVRLRLEADRLSLVALITRGAREDLGLEVGARVVAQIKATALHVFPL